MSTIANIPDVHAFDRDIPAGKVLLAEYSQITPADRRASKTVLATKTGWGRTEVRLVACFAGWNIAGSMMRWDNGSFAVLWDFEGAQHGQHYKTFENAIDHFKRIPETH